MQRVINRYSDELVHSVTVQLNFVDFNAQC